MLLHVLMCLWDQYQSEDSVSKTHVPDRSRVTRHAEGRFLAFSVRWRRRTAVLQLVADHIVVSERRIFTILWCENALTMQSACKTTTCVLLPQPTTKKRPPYDGQENVYWTMQQWTSILFIDEPRFILLGDSGRLLITFYWKLK